MEKLNTPRIKGTKLIAQLPKDCDPKETRIMVFDGSHTKLSCVILNPRCKPIFVYKDEVLNDV